MSWSMKRSQRHPMIPQIRFPSSQMQQRKKRLRMRTMRKHRIRLTKKRHRKNLNRRRLRLNRNLLAKSRRSQRSQKSQKSRSRHLNQSPNPLRKKNHQLPPLRQTNSPRAPSIKTSRGWQHVKFLKARQRSSSRQRQKRKSNLLMSNANSTSR